MAFFIRFLTILFFATAAQAQSYALETPGSVGMRGGFDAAWTAPEGTSGLIEIRPAEGGRRAGYGYTNSNPVRMEAPEAPGDYVVVLIIDNEDRASQPLQVTPATATLEAPTETDAGAAITVAWAGPNNRNDFITFAEPDGPSIRGSSYSYVGNSKDGTVTLTAPQDSGRYDIVYVSGKTVLARSPISVGGIEATLTAAAQVAAGAPLVVGFKGPENGQDLITFAARDGDRISPASYTYVGNSDGKSVTLRAFEEPGAYDVVYVSGGRIIGRTPVEVTATQMEITAPASVTARQIFEVVWKGQGNAGDRINMIPQGGDSVVTYRYIDPLTPTVRVHAPEDAGAYTLIYVSRGGREMARRDIAVTPAPANPGQLEVGFFAAGGTGNAIEVILDASGSMLQRQNGERRIEIAKRTLTDLVTRTIPLGTGFALRVFGNREADACRTDLEIPLGPHDPAAAAQTIAGITAVNLAKTPIAQSIELSRGDLAGVTGERVLIVVTDGAETCDGDPGEAIAKLRADGTDVRVNIVGYAIDDAELARTFEAWAAAGAGAYFDAGDADQLATALQQATAPPFRVLDADGTLVGAGTAGDPPMTLPAGRYAVQIAGTEVAVDVVSDKVTTLTP